jgi:hypothetical protein
MAGCPWCSLQFTYLQPYLKGLWNILNVQFVYVAQIKPMFSWWLDTEARDIDKRDSYLGFTAGETYSGFQSFHGEDEVYEHGEQSSMLKLKQHSLSMPEILGFCPIFICLCR